MKHVCTLSISGHPITTGSLNRTFRGVSRFRFIARWLARSSFKEFCENRMIHHTNFALRETWDRAS